MSQQPHAEVSFSDETQAEVELSGGRVFLFTLLCLWVASLMFRQEDLAVRPDRILFGLLVCATLYYGVQGRLLPLGFGRLEWMFAIFTGFCAFSLVNSGAGQDNGVPWNTRVNEVLNMTVYPFGVFLLARQLPYSRDHVRWLLGFLVVLAAYLAFTAMCERFGLKQLIWPKYITDPEFGIHYGRARGPFVQSVFMGLSLTICLMAVLLALASAPSKLRSIGLALLVAACLAGVYLTNTRGPWVALGLALLTGVVIRSRVRWFCAGVCGLILCGFMFTNVSKFSLARGNLFKQRQHTIEQRDLNYRIAFHMGLDHPLVGVGWSRMGQEFDRYFNKHYKGEAWTGWDGNHNEYLGLFAETGIVPALLYVGILFTLGWRLWRATRELPDHMELERGLAVCALAGLVGLAFIAYFNQVRAGPFHIVIVFLLCGLVECARQAAAALAEEPLVE